MGNGQCTSRDSRRTPQAYVPESGSNRRREGDGKPDDRFQLWFKHLSVFLGLAKPGTFKPQQTIYLQPRETRDAGISDF